MNWIGLYGLLLRLLLLSNNGESKIIKTLPGYSGTLPFKLETGYISVGEDDQVQLFYYFAESENNPATDPLLLSISGGPGCSGLISLAFDIGPLTFDVENYDGGLPSILINPYSWTKGYIIGNGITDPNIDFNARIPYAHRMALISDEYFELAKTSCDGKYYNCDSNNPLCANALQPIKECLSNINGVQIYQRSCIIDELDYLRCGQNFIVARARKIERGDNSDDHPVLPTAVQDCLDIHLVSDSWANDQTVQEALSIRKGTITNWTTCYVGIPFEHNIDSVLEFHKVLMKKGLDVLVFNGDLDMGAPYIGPLTWIRILNLTIDKSWRAWLVNDQVAGYTEKYKDDSHLTFATIKGAGHIASWYKPEESLAMISRWLSRSSL